MSNFTAYVARKAQITVAISVALATTACTTSQDTAPKTDLTNPELARIYFNHSSVEPDFTLHVWNNESCTGFVGDNTDWQAGLEPSGHDPKYGLFWDLPIDASAKCLNFIAHRFNPDYQTADLELQFDLNQNKGAKIGYVFKDTNRVFYTPSSELPDTRVSIEGTSAHWITPTQLLLPKKSVNVTLYTSAIGGMSINEQEGKIEGATSSVSAKRVNQSSWKTQYPHLANDFDLFQFDPLERSAIDKMVRGELLIASYTEYQGKRQIDSVTRVQTGGLLDALYADEAVKRSYGAQFNQESHTTDFTLWAPTAQQVKLIPYTDDLKRKTPILMRRDNTSGSWSVENTDLAHGDYYRYEVTLYHPQSQQVETLEVTDPYSLSLSTNSAHSQVVDLNDERLKPEGWDTLTVPNSQENPASFVIYETHVRDFSALDESTKYSHRGKYLAFTEAHSNPVKHLKSLSSRGATHLHLLPVFDIATINEKVADRVDINQPFSQLCQAHTELFEIKPFKDYCDDKVTIKQALAELANTDKASKPWVQQLNRYISATDSFNWGYDPYHYTVPEGSYATQTQGMQRILEFRQMVSAIKSDIKMNLVMDVVYNHTNGSGLADKSVLDKIVPNYYHRLDPLSGAVEQSTCCSNTAPERVMMKKLITDSLVVWARDYKVDAFRWDLMGHHPKSQILDSLAAVQKISPHAYFYGEGWDFGEVAGDRMFRQATQLNLHGSGIGTFSDRMRDAVRGGSPFDSGKTIRATQGFGNGAYVYPNELSKVTEAEAKHLADLVRLGMAGNLKDYPLLDSQDQKVKGDQIDYRGAPAGYAKDAWETVNYVEKHDNQTLWDSQQYKIPFDADLNTRIKMQALSLATVMYGQNVVFHHMGSELLRSKSMQRDSYDSGDWYNRVDFTKADNNWDKGLPRADKDKDNWKTIETIYKKTQGRVEVSTQDILRMERYFKEMMEIRTTSPLFTLGEGTEIIKRVKFHNTGSKQVPGLIVMSIDDRAPFKDIDSQYRRIVVVLNARNEATTVDQLDFSEFKLHPFHTQLGTHSLAYGSDISDKTVTVPAWSAVVFTQ